MGRALSQSLSALKIVARPGSAKAPVVRPSALRSAEVSGAPSTGPDVPLPALPQGGGSARPAAPQASRSGFVLLLQARVLAQDNVAAATTLVCAELALIGGCERVSIGLHQKGRLEVVAISGATEIRARQGPVQQLVSVMEEACDQGQAVLTPAADEGLQPIALAQAGLSRISGHEAVYAVPIMVRELAVGALVLEGARPFEAATLRMARDVALLVGPVLALRQRDEASAARRLIEGLKAPRASNRDRARPFARLPWIVGAILLGLVFALWPVSEHVIAPARIEGAIQRVLAAPVDGFVQTVGVRPGEAVRAGQVLLSLDDRELGLERERARAALAQLDKVYGEALAQDEAGPIALARARMDQARSELALAEEQLARSRLSAPFDGVVISGDLVQSVGMPVKRGQSLLTLAPDRSFRAVIEADEQDVSRLTVGQRAHILFAAWAGDPVDVRIARVAPVATVLGERNVFELEAPVDARESLRPGLRGIARVEVGHRARIAIVWDRAARWLRRTAWRALG